MPFHFSWLLGLLMRILWLFLVSACLCKWGVIFSWHYTLICFLSLPFFLLYIFILLYFLLFIIMCIWGVLITVSPTLSYLLPILIFPSFSLSVPFPESQLLLLFCDPSVWTWNSNHPLDLGRALWWPFLVVLLTTAVHLKCEDPLLI